MRLLVLVWLVICSHLELVRGDHICPRGAPLLLRRAKTSPRTKAQFSVNGLSARWTLTERSCRVTAARPGGYELTIVVPTFNERQNVGPLVARLRQGARWLELGGGLR